MVLVTVTISIAGLLCCAVVGLICLLSYVTSSAISGPPHLYFEDAI